jgi:small subunit ribosomal protein S17
VKNNKVERVLAGKVLSNVRDKTISILIERKVRHPVYKKYIKLNTKIHAHDKNNECALGDIVKVVEAKPFSKTKHWELLEIIEKFEVID